MTRKIGTRLSEIWFGDPGSGKKTYPGSGSRGQTIIGSQIMIRIMDNVEQGGIELGIQNFQKPIFLHCSRQFRSGFRSGKHTTTVFYYHIRGQFMYLHGEEKNVRIPIKSSGSASLIYNLNSSTDCVCRLFPRGWPSDWWWLGSSGLHPASNRLDSILC